MRCVLLLLVPEVGEREEPFESVISPAAAKLDRTLLRLAVALKSELAAAPTGLEAAEGVDNEGGAAVCIISKVG